MPQTQLLSEKDRGHIRHPFPIIPCLVILQWTNLHLLSTLSSCVFRPDSSALTLPFGGGRDDPQEKRLLHPDPHQFGANVLWEAEIILKLQDSAALGIYFCWQKKRENGCACMPWSACTVCTAFQDVLTNSLVCRFAEIFAEKLWRSKRDTHN